MNLLANSTAQPTHPRSSQLVGKLIATYKGTGSADFLSWSPDGKRLAVGGSDANGTQIWDVTTGNRIATSTYKINTFDQIYSTNTGAWINDRFYIAIIDDSNSQNPVIRVRDLVGNKEIVAYQGYVNERNTFAGATAPESLSWSPDGKMIASTGIAIWNASTGRDISQCQVQYKSNTPVSSSLYDFSFAWAPDSRHIASWGQPGVIHVWDSSNGKMVCYYRKHFDQHMNDGPTLDINPTIYWSPDSTRIVSYVKTDQVYHSVDGVIHVWDARNGKEICTYNNGQPNNGPAQIAWSADSKLIASVTDNGCTVWDASSGAIVTLRYTPNRDIISWHPQRPYIASLRRSVTDKDDSQQTYTEQAYIWNATTGKKLIQLNSNTFDGLAWSPDGMRLAISTYDQNVQIWQIWQ